MWPADSFSIPQKPQEVGESLRAGRARTNGASTRLTEWASEDAEPRGPV